MMLAGSQATGSNRFAMASVSSARQVCTATVGAPWPVTGVPQSDSFTHKAIRSFYPIGCNGPYLPACRQPMAGVASFCCRYAGPRRWRSSVTSWLWPPRWSEPSGLPVLSDAAGRARSTLSGTACRSGFSACVAVSYAAWACSFGGQVPRWWHGPARYAYARRPSPVVPAALDAGFAVAPDRLARDVLARRRVTSVPVSRGSA